IWQRRGRHLQLRYRRGRRGRPGGRGRPAGLSEGPAFLVEIGPPVVLPARESSGGDVALRAAPQGSGAARSALPQALGGCVPACLSSEIGRGIKSSDRGSGLPVPADAERIDDVLLGEGLKGVSPRKDRGASSSSGNEPVSQQPQSAPAERDSLSSDAALDNW